MRGFVCAVLILGSSWVLSLRADDELTIVDRLARQHLAYIYGSEDV